MNIEDAMKAFEEMFPGHFIILDLTTCISQSPPPGKDKPEWREPDYSVSVSKRDGIKQMTTRFHGGSWDACVRKATEYTVS